MLAQDCRVKTVRMKGSVSPWRCTIDAIWITGSLSGSGKIPGNKEATPESFDFHQVRPALVMRLHNFLTVILTQSKNSREFFCKQSTFSSCALYVKAEDSERCNPLPVSLCRVTYQVLPSHIHLILTQGGLEGKNKSGKVHKNHLPIQIHWTWKWTSDQGNIVRDCTPTFPGDWELVLSVLFSSRTLYFPFGSWIQQQPTTSLSTINLTTHTHAWIHTHTV